jgi:hypothetical protein
MLRFLLGMLVGAAAAATWLTRRAAARPAAYAGGRVDELSTAAGNVIADPALDAGDGAADRSFDSARAAVSR